MTQLLEWFTRYSPTVVLLLALAAGLLFVVKLIVERSIASGFDRKTRMFDAFLKRRSAFEEKVLSDRFALVTSLHARLENVMTNLNRRRKGKPPTAGFIENGEIVPLTSVFEDLEIHRLVLGEDFHALFTRMARMALETANVAMSDSEAWEKSVEGWPGLRQEIRVEAERNFGINQIHW